MSRPVTINSDSNFLREVRTKTQDSYSVGLAQLDELGPIPFSDLGARVTLNLLLSVMNRSISPQLIIKLCMAYSLHDFLCAWPVTENTSLHWSFFSFFFDICTDHDLYYHQTCSTIDSYLAHIICLSVGCSSLAAYNVIYILVDPLHIAAVSAASIWLVARLH